MAPPVTFVVAGRRARREVAVGAGTLGRDRNVGGAGTARASEAILFQRAATCPLMRFSSLVP
jgi:hypothetical protein